MAAWVPITAPPPALKPRPTTTLAWLAALYTCRVAIVNALLLLLLPAICLSLAPTLLMNLLVMSAWSLFFCSAAAYVLAWSIQVTYRVTAINRGERFFLPGPDAISHPSAIARMTTIALPIPLLFWILRQRTLNGGDSSLFAYLAAAAGGFVLAYVIAFFAVVIATLVAPPGHVTAVHFLTVFFGWQRRLLVRADQVHPFNFHWDPARWPNGYLDTQGRLYGGHWIAITSFMLSLLLYITLGFLKSSSVPALSYVLQIEFLIVWALGGATFFLDRYRIPVMVPIGLVLLVNLTPSVFPGIWSSLPAWFPSSDHYYKIWQIPKSQQALPADVLEAYLQKTAGNAIVVTTAGGGIQAAAWTAEVLTQLQAGTNAPEGKARFADSIALFSGVSGGSVGLMFFGAKYPGTKDSVFPTTNLDSILTSAETPALNDVAWGLTNADVTRVVFPYLKFGPAKLDDRGKALENAWKRSKGIGDVSLSAWTHGVADAWRPAFLFNSTISETGEPMVFATSKLNYSEKTFGQKNQVAHRHTFFADFPDRDLEVVTAARLSASFSFVTPAARPLQAGPANHVVDGGYYDNYGVNSLTAWLAEALDKRVPGDDKSKPRILVLQIQSFPQAQFGNAGWKTWFYQLYAPLDALFNVRDTGQTMRDSEELRTFEEAYSPKAKFFNACFVFPGNDAPVSWQLNQPQEDAVKQKWDSQSEGLGIVQSFLNGSVDPAPKDCVRP